MSFLVVLPPVLGQLWCLSWWFCLLSWDNSDRCGIFWLGWLMDVGRYEGVAPSMWAFAAWFWRMSGSCAIYVPKRQLDVEKKWGETSAVPIFHLGSPRKADPTKCQVSFGNSGKSSFSGDLVGTVFRGQAKWQIARAQKMAKNRSFLFRDIDGATHFWNASKKIFLAFEWDLRDIDGATQFPGIAMQLYMSFSIFVCQQMLKNEISSHKILSTISLNTFSGSFSRYCNGFFFEDLNAI